MVDKDVVLEKVGQIQNSIKRIHEKTKNDPSALDNLDIQDIVALNLQRAIQTTIDLAGHVVADEGLGLPNTIKENFSILQKNKIIDKALSEKMQKMVGFRNIAVHEYAIIDKEVLKAIVTSRLPDLEKFYATILEQFHIIK
ncbi:MAG: transcriptional regulator [Deltaproteobacteria bacterium RIFCSPLOWO2_12_FULL_40_28]|nr:MAG: transcriptional regulator [Deltaproteobacteria bacterium RIFCSPHIGHO2_02_FULL_40_28]OGQ20226.1 MAG: transcriptional regulator [Deltaproteobacteria bacterium RIFCSPHIGHO2_12_FULL_40_32]OGQ40345.1 MAG: transcriptional regulator [Deltaproteobacteria bacterium RIFCSPLOWO2_02_FULL_40_36]OGQ54799.1 MAG: transcriptional regulator [Deltaproteobacteria bacterium RIFCSPLOWO2_12_FULL_40_28]